jgi:hypothetical protein
MANLQALRLKRLVPLLPITPQSSDRRASPPPNAPPSAIAAERISIKPGDSLCVCTRSRPLERVSFFCAPVVFKHTNTFNNDPFYSNGASARFAETTNDTEEVGRLIGCAWVNGFGVTAFAMQCAE